MEGNGFGEIHSTRRVSLEGKFYIVSLFYKIFQTLQLVLN